MAKLKDPMTPVEMYPDKLEGIVLGLFPSQNSEFTANRLVSNDEIVTVTKAPGSDGIPNVALKEAILTYTDMFR